VLPQLSCPSCPFPATLPTAFLTLLCCRCCHVLSVFSRKSWPFYLFQADLSGQPHHTGCPGWPILVGLAQMSYQLSCQNFPIPVVLSFLSFSGHPLLSFLSWLYYPDCLLWLYCTGCPTPAFLSRLSCPDCPVPAILLWLSCPSSLAPALLSQVTFPLHVLVVLSSLSCPS
jgi:hypothetical protein